MPVPKRVSALLVTLDLPGASGLYDELGFTRVDTDDPGCVGYVAGETGVILADWDFAVRCWGPAATAELAGRFAPYVFLARIEGAAAEATRVLVDVRTSSGTRERIISTPSGPVILAERVV